ncbi:MAG: DUF2812 domain-containing protein [Firmicutes bacterium]|nr:DUF2812 domain-containing protein [Bacillota bacterium]
MKKRVYKVFTNYEKEEVWLNRMAASGWHCTDYFFCRYIFTKGEPGEYTYRIQLLDNSPDHPENAEYLELLADAGIEVISSHLRWVYLRKKTAAGPFELFSDRESRIAHYKKIITMLLPVALVNFAFGFGLLHNPKAINSLNLAAALLVTYPLISYYRRIQALEKDGQIHE